jgi:hypothetical protein
LPPLPGLPARRNRGTRNDGPDGPPVGVLSYDGGDGLGGTGDLTGQRGEGDEQEDGPERDEVLVDEREEEVEQNKEGRPDLDAADWIWSKRTPMPARSADRKPTTMSMTNCAESARIPTIPIVAFTVERAFRPAIRRICRKVETNMARAAMKARWPVVQARPGPRLPSSPSRIRITP